MMDDVKHTPGERVRAYLAARATMTGMDRDAIHTVAIAAGTFQLLVADLEALSTPLRDAAPSMRVWSPRAIEMLRIAAHIIREHAPEAMHHYDCADCDGWCIADDCDAAAERLSDAIAKATGGA